MKPALAALGFLLALVVLAPAAHPQYMYLDTNGDGVHTAADVIAPTGVTTIDVWIRTDANRDGSPVTCAWGAYPMSINSYEFILRAGAGTISWGEFTNRQPAMDVSLLTRSSPTEFYAGRAGATILPPGLYHLATLSVTVAAGTPSISIVPRDALRGTDETAFGCKCPGVDDDNTLKLGTEWFDTDGAAYGGVNNPPQLLQPLDMDLAEGTVAEQQVTASDPDGWTMSFSKASGPTFMTVATVNPGPGSAVGRIRLAPGYRDAGETAGAVQASDGAMTDVKVFGIHVTDVNLPPVLPGIRDVCIEQGQSHTVTITASDPDGDPVQLSVTGLPPFAAFVDNANGSATLGMAPSETEPLSQPAVTVTASDGHSTASRTFHIVVKAPMECFVGGGGFASGGNQPPVAMAGGPYSSVAGLSVTVDGGRSYDPEGSQLNYYWSFGDGARGLGVRSSHVYENSGVYGVILQVSDGNLFRADTTSANIAEPLRAEATAPKGHTTIHLGSGKPAVCVSLEPVDGAFRSEEVELATVEMKSRDTGSVQTVSAMTGKDAHLSDRDGDGVLEIEVCFRMEDLRRLLGSVSNDAEVNVRIEGNLTTGGRFRAPFSMRVLTEGPRMQAAVFPNPFNPSAVLRFETIRPGFARVRLYDARGRLVRVLLDEPIVAAGVHDVRIGQGPRGGDAFASGVYFYRIETPEGTSQGRLVVAK